MATRKTHHQDWWQTNIVTVPGMLGEPKQKPLRQYSKHFLRCRGMRRHGLDTVLKGAARKTRAMWPSFNRSHATGTHSEKGLSPERWRRRGLTGRWLHPALCHTALYGLQERGSIHASGQLSRYEAQSMDHPALPLEALADQIISHHLSIRDPRPQAWKAWQLASAHPIPIHQLACFLVSLALHNPFLVQIGTRPAAYSGGWNRATPCDSRTCAVVGGARPTLSRCQPLTQSLSSRLRPKQRL